MEQRGLHVEPRAEQAARGEQSQTEKRQGQVLKVCSVPHIWLYTKPAHPAQFQLQVPTMLFLFKPIGSGLLRIDAHSATFHGL